MRTVLLLALLVLLLLAMGVALKALLDSTRDPRDAQRTQNTAPPPPATPAPHALYPVPEPPPTAPVPTIPLALIPMPGDDTRFLALGDIDSLALTERRPTTLLSTETITRTAQDFTLGLNLPLQFATGLQQGSNIVRLAPETVQALKNGAKFVESGGKLTGVLRGADGRIVEVVRFTSVSTALSAAAGVGTALTMAAMQMQLAAISKKLDALRGQIERLDEGLSNERLAEIESLSMSVFTAWNSAPKPGVCPTG